ncbi:MAG: iron-containing alcohol dehydrogenase [Clostridiales bacterium]|nr:iron-containing alcohol dehydrogenase [Clostridiales bacterium]
MNNKNITEAFHFLLPTKIVYGPGCLKDVTAQLQAIGGKRPILVTDKGVQKAGIAAQVTDQLDQAGISYVIYDGVEANPKDINVEEAAGIAREFGADSIIAVGGGSPIDCAKSVGVLMAHDGDKIKKYEGKTAATEPLPPFITIPTTSGTGSELTFSSVITDTLNKYKMTIKSPYTAAKVAICDPLLTLSVPAHVTAATGVDALTHAIEAYTANCSEPVSDAVALYAIELIYENLVEAVNNGSNLEARSAMLMGSMLAGIAFSHSDVASVHCVAESLGGVYDLPHGVCNAIFLPYVMEYNMTYCEEKYARVARAMGLSFQSPQEGAKLAVEAVKKLCKDVKLPPFRSLNVNTEEFDRIAEMSVKNISTESNPRPMTKEDYLVVLKNAYEAN